MSTKRTTRQRDVQLPPTPDRIQVDVTAKLNLQEMQQALTPQQIAAVMGGIAQVMQAQKTKW